MKTIDDTDLLPNRQYREQFFQHGIGSGLVAGLAGAAWNVVTFLVIPVIAAGGLTMSSEQPDVVKNEVAGCLPTSACSR